MNHNTNSQSIEEWRERIQSRLEQLEKTRDHWHSTMVSRDADTFFILPNIAFEATSFALAALFTLIAVSKLHSPYFVLILLPFTVSFLRKLIILISLDRKIEHIDSPVAFLKNFIYAQIYHFHMRAYSMLAPWTRTPGKVKPPTLQHMPVEYDMDEITGPESLGDYWASFLLPGDEAYRIPRIQTIDLISENSKLEIALVQVKLNVRYTLGDGNLKRIAKFIRHLSTVFRGHTEQIILTKLLIRRLDRWFIAEAEAEGELDHLPPQLLPML